MAKSKPTKKLVVAFVDNSSKDIVVLDILKLNTKNEDLKLLQQSAKDAVKTDETEITLPEESRPAALDYSDYKEAEVELPHHVDAILTVLVQDTFGL
jgi:hypothetical protein